MGTGSLPGAKSGWGVTLTPHPVLVPWPRKIRAIHLLPLWAVRPVQSLSACTSVRFTFTYTSTPPMGRTACTEPQCLYNGALYLYLYLYSPYGPYGLYRASVPVQQCTLPLPRPLLPLWTVRPVQSLSACTTVHFTFTYLFTNTLSSFMDFHRKLLLLRKLQGGLDWRYLDLCFVLHKFQGKSGFVFCTAQFASRSGLEIYGFVFFTAQISKQSWFVFCTAEIARRSRLEICGFVFCTAQLKKQFGSVLHKEHSGLNPATDLILPVWRIEQPHPGGTFWVPAAQNSGSVTCTWPSSACVRTAGGLPGFPRFQFASEKCNYSAFFVWPNMSICYVIR